MDKDTKEKKKGRARIGPPTPIAFPAELKARAEEIASARGISLAELVREALQAHIGDGQGRDYYLALVVGQSALAALREAESKDAGEAEGRDAGEAEEKTAN